MFSSTSDRALLGQLEEPTEELSGNGQGSEADIRKRLELESSGKLCVCVHACVCMHVCIGM